MMDADFLPAGMCFAKSMGVVSTIKNIPKSQLFSSCVRGCLG